MATAEMEVEVLDADDAPAADGKEKKVRIPLDKDTVGIVYASKEECEANPVKNAVGEAVSTHRAYKVLKGDGTVVGFVNAKNDVDAVGLWASSKGYVGECLTERGRKGTAGVPDEKQLAFGRMVVATGNKMLIDAFLVTIDPKYHGMFQAA